MSEYQYYEFLAIDRPLDAREQQQLRAVSSRARITAIRFVNTYEWGDLRADPRALMASYFDASLYLANWGTRQLMFRLPSSVLDLDVVGRYCATDTRLRLGCRRQRDRVVDEREGGRVLGRQRRGVARLDRSGAFGAGDG